MGSPESGCARPAASETTPDDHWMDCISEIANYDFSEPGTVLRYGPWHLMVASGMAMKSISQPLTAEAWISLVYEEVYLPAGITAQPVYEPMTYLNLFGTPQTGAQLPDFSGGLIMTARELANVMHAVQFGQLLPEVWLQRFLSDEDGKNVTDGNTAISLSIGGWRYGQGHWIACDAAAEHFGDLHEWTLEEANSMCEDGRSPEIHHSVGFFGAYAWMDLTTNCYGVFMQHWDLRVTSILHMALVLCLLTGVTAGISLAMVCCRSGNTQTEEQGQSEMQQKLHA